MDDKIKDLEKKKEYATLEKDIANERTQIAQLKAGEAEAARSHGSSWRKVVGYVSGMSSGMKLQSLRSAGFGLGHLREPNVVKPRQFGPGI